MKYLDNIKDAEEAGYDSGKTDGIEIGKTEGIEIGKTEGIEIGKTEGIEIGKIESAKNLINILDDETISKHLDLDIITVKNLRNKL